RGCSRGVRTGMAGIVHRCLAARAADRYADAAGVAADLRRHLADLPLRGAPNGSLLERWRKWQRRRPNATLWAGLFLGLIASGVAFGAVALERIRGAHEALREGQVQMQRRARAPPPPH